MAEIAGACREPGKQENLRCGMGISLNIVDCRPRGKREARRQSTQKGGKKAKQSGCTAQEGGCEVDPAGQTSS